MLLYYISASASSIHPPPRVSTPSSDLFFSSLLFPLIFLISHLLSSRTSFSRFFFFSHRPFPCRCKPRRLLPTLLLIPPSHFLFSLFDIYAICHLRSLLRSLSSRSLRRYIEEVVWKVWKGKKVHDRHGNEALRLPRNKTNTG